MDHHVVANNDLLLREPDLIRGFLAACRQSYRYAAEHRDRWADFGAGISVSLAVP
jgi:ABC-type nitrate/sulfonate/bicarbonate transport system substrate-binding protein